MYKAIVCCLEDVEKHPNADNLILAKALGYKIITTKQNQEGQVGLFFPCDGQLSEQFANVNNLVRKKDENGNNVGGFFEENRRVRDLKLRGIKSEGFWIPLRSLEKFGDYEKLNVGQQIDEFEGVKICNKYYTPKTREYIQKAKNQKKKERREIEGFKKHFDTEPIKKSIYEIPSSPGFIIISEKTHGTSHRSTHCYVSKEPNKFHKFLNWCKKKLNRKQQEFGDWEFLNGTRNVILYNDREDGGFHNGHKFRFDVSKKFIHLLKKGETVYGEIVGYDDHNNPIMSPHNTKELKDKEFTKKYGERMEYRYGCNVETNKNDFYVYRITRTTVDGDVLDLSWSQMVDRCKDLKLKAVPLLKYEFVDNLREHVKKNLDLYEQLSEGVSTLDCSHIREGICLRIEPFESKKMNIYKLKSWTFGVLEGYLKNDESMVDVEEIS